MITPARRKHPWNRVDLLPRCRRYTHRLGGALLGLLSNDDGRDLAAILGTTIGEIAAEHRTTCDIANPSSPQATVLNVRAPGDRLDRAEDTC